MNRSVQPTSLGILLFLSATSQCGNGLMAPVRVTVSGVENTEANRLGANTVEFETFFLRTAPGDAGRAETLAHGATWNQGLEARRVLFWDGTRGTFSYTVLLPIEAYGAVRVEARIARRCGDGVQHLLIAEGQSNSPFVPTSNGQASVTVTIEPRSELCQ